jgi:hypothetical protein
MRPFSHRLSLRLCGVAFAALAAVACSSGRAAAACGDYVHVVTDGAQADSPAMPGEPDLPRPPCHGPGCSGQPTPPIPPLTAPVTEPTGAKELATRAAGDAGDHGGSARHPVPEAIGSPVRTSTPIFHPPRFA